MKAYYFIYDVCGGGSGYGPQAGECWMRDGRLWPRAHVLATAIKHQIRSGEWKSEINLRIDRPSARPFVSVWVSVIEPALPRSSARQSAHKLSATGLNDIHHATAHGKMCTHTHPTLGPLPSMMWWCMAQSGETRCRISAIRIRMCRKKE